MRDKGRLPPGQPVNWVIPRDGIVLIDRAAGCLEDFSAEVIEARHLALPLASLDRIAIQREVRGIRQQ